MPLVFNVVPKRAGIIRVRLPVTSADWSEHFIACAGNLQTCPRLHFFWIGTLSFNRSTGFLKNASRGMEVRDIGNVEQTERSIVMPREI